jgi:hypothetical protein
MVKNYSIADDDIYERLKLWIRFDKAPESNTTVIRMMDKYFAYPHYLYIATDKTLCIYNTYDSSHVCGAVLDVNTWYELDIMIKYYVHELPFNTEYGYIVVKANGTTYISATKDTGLENYKGIRVGIISNYSVSMDLWEDNPRWAAQTTDFIDR